MNEKIASEEILTSHTIGYGERDAESAHHVKSRSVQEEKKPNRRFRRAEVRYQEREAEKKAAEARKQKKLTKSEMIALARQRQGLPPLPQLAKEPVQVSIQETVSQKVVQEPIQETVSQEVVQEPIQETIQETVSQEIVQDVK